MESILDARKIQAEWARCERECPDQTHPQLEFLRGCISAHQAADLGKGLPDLTFVPKTSLTQCIHDFLYEGTVCHEVYLVSSPTDEGMLELLFCYLAPHGVISCCHKLWSSENGTAFVCYSHSCVRAVSNILNVITEYPIRTSIGTTFRHLPVWQPPNWGWREVYEAVRKWLAPLDNYHDHEAFLDAKLGRSHEEQRQTREDYRCVAMLMEPEWNAHFPLV